MQCMNVFNLDWKPQRSENLENKVDNVAVDKVRRGVWDGSRYVIIEEDEDNKFGVNNDSEGCFGLCVEGKIGNVNDVIEENDDKIGGVNPVEPGGGNYFADGDKVTALLKVMVDSLGQLVHEMNRLKLNLEVLLALQD